MLLLKCIVWCSMIVFLVQNSYSFDVKCVYENDKNNPDENWCKIEKLEKIKLGYQLNLIVVEAEYITGCYLLNLPAMKSIPNEIFVQMPSLEKILIENVGIEHLTKDLFVKPREKVWKLAIKRSKLKTIERDFLVFLPNLVWLDLSKIKFQR